MNLLRFIRLNGVRNGFVAWRAHRAVRVRLAEMARWGIMKEESVELNRAQRRAVARRAKDPKRASSR